MKWNIHIYDPKSETTTTHVKDYPGTSASMADAPAVVAKASRDFHKHMQYILAVPHREAKRHHATKKSPAQLQREIDQALRSPTVRAAAKAVQRGSGGGEYVMAAERSGDRPKTFPKRFQHGLYTATFKGIDERFPGDTLASAHWKITRRGKEVGTMHEGSAYGWGRPTSTMRQLVWGGEQPPGASDSRTPEYGLTFDQGPADGHTAALTKFARAADRLIEWRQKHGYPAMGFKRSGKAKRATA